MTAKVWLSEDQIRGAERTLSIGTWAITFGAILFSVLTVTPLVSRVTPGGPWQWTAPILPLVVDAAVVIVIRLDSTVARLNGDGGRWPVVLRWLTGMFTVALNIGDSALKGNLVGVAVHAVAPALLIVTGEAGLAYRRAIAQALDRIAREQTDEAERQRVHEQREREAHEQAEREREHAAREERERERELADRREREAREHAAQMAREERQFEADQRREQEARADRLEKDRRDREAQAAERQREREEQDRRDREAKAAREQREKAAREQADRAAGEREERRAVNTKPKPVNTSAKEPVNTDRLPEEEARRIVVNTASASVRQLAEATGWSIGWVSKVRREAGAAGAEEAEEATAAA